MSDDDIYFDDDNNDDCDSPRDELIKEGHISIGFDASKRDDDMGDTEYFVKYKNNDDGSFSKETTELYGGHSTVLSNIEISNEQYESEMEEISSRDDDNENI